VRLNRWTVRNRHSNRLRLAAVIACVALVVAVGVITSALIREPEPAEISVIELPKSADTGTATPTATPTPGPGGFAPPDADDDADDPFDDDDD